MTQRWRKGAWRNDTYIAGNAWFTCDRCGTRFRRSQMITEWDGLKVDIKCLDPRPPQMIPPVIYPEGVPFTDARPPQDNSDRMQDDTSLQSVAGGFIVVPAGQLNPADQRQQPGALSPQPVIENSYEVPLLNEDGTPITTESGQIITVFVEGTPQGPNVLEDDITIITGLPPSVDE